MGPLFTFDPTINLGVVFHLITLLGALGLTIWGASFKFARVENLLKSFDTRLKSVEVHMDKITTILVDIGKQEVRLDSLDKRIDKLELTQVR